MFTKIIFAIAAYLLFQFLFVRTFLNFGKRLFSESYSRIKMGVWGALIWSNVYPVIMLAYFLFVFVAGFKIELPANLFIDYLIIYPFWIFFILTVQVDVLFLLTLFVFYVYKFFTKENLNDYLPKVYFVIVVIFAVYIPVRVVYDYYSVDVNEIKFVKKSLPQELDDLRIAFISDLQADAHTDESRLNSFVNKVNKLSPDIILIGGDLITGSPDYIESSARSLAKLKAKYGVYSCVGDHDNWAYRSNPKRSLREIKAAFAKRGIPVLDDQNIYIPVKGKKILVTFLTNTYVEQISNDEATSLVKNKNTGLKILLTHQPVERLMNIASVNNYDMYLAGHTHGGQITIFFPFFNLSPTLFETRYVRGDFNFNNMFVYVTRGLGMSIAPLRYNSTPEITLITLSKE